MTAAFSCGSGYGKTDQGACAKHDLTVVATGPGAVEPAAGTYPHPHGAVVEVTATPAANAAVAWAGCGSTNGNVCTVTMDMERTVTAAFSCGSGYGKTDQGACAKHDLTVVATGPGAVEPAAGTYPHPHGAVVEVTATPGRQRRRGLGRVRLHERERLHGDDGHEADGDRGLRVRVRLREDRRGGVREARFDGRGDGARDSGAQQRDSTRMAPSRS